MADVNMNIEVNDNFNKSSTIRGLQSQTKRMMREYVGNSGERNVTLQSGSSLLEEPSWHAFRRNDKSVISVAGSVTTVGKSSTDTTTTPRISKAEPERINQKQRKAKMKKFLRNESTTSSSGSEYRQLVDFSSFQGINPIRENARFPLFDRTSINSAGFIELSSSYEEREMHRARREEEEERQRKKKKSKMSAEFTVRPMRINLKPYQIEELKEAFNMLENGMELIEIANLPTIIRACGFEPDNDEVREILDEIKPINEGFLTMSELIKVFEAKLKRNDPLEEIRRAFKVFDLNNSGMITLDNLKEVSKCVGEKLHEEEMKEMISAADKTHSGGVTMENFVKLITRKEYFD